MKRVRAPDDLRSVRRSRKPHGRFDELEEDEKFHDGVVPVVLMVLMVVVGGESNLRRPLKFFFKILHICMACKLCYEVLSSVWLLWVTTSEVRLRIGQ